MSAGARSVVSRAARSAKPATISAMAAIPRAAPVRYVAVVGRGPATGEERGGLVTGLVTETSGEGRAGCAATAPPSGPGGRLS